MFKNHPKGLIPAALANMGERFGYYIMNAVLVLFLCSKFGLDNDQSTMIYSIFYCGIYVLSIIAKTKRAEIENEMSKTSLFSLPFFSCIYWDLNNN